MSVVRGLGYSFGAFVAFPLIMIVVNYLFFRGNQVTPEQVTKYISDSVIVELYIPEVGDEENCTKYILRIYYPELPLSRGRGNSNHTKTINQFVFFSKEYQRYFMLINFDGFDYGGEFNLDQNDERIRYIYNGSYIFVHANMRQWNDTRYGSENQPVPVFGFEVSGRDFTNPDVLQDAKRYFDVPERVNRLFVEQYLDHFLPAKDFERLFTQ